MGERFDGGVSRHQPELALRLVKDDQFVRHAFCQGATKTPQTQTRLFVVRVVSHA
jgi:hypothetical protein